jgi:diguanylate cyclase (GGDEF)-like protein
MFFRKKPEKGISLRQIHSWLIVISVIISAIMILSTFRLTANFIHVTDVSQEHIELEKASYELMEASDYLTEQVQRFAVSGERQFMEAYFSEAFESKRREQAIAQIGVDANATAAREELQKAMDESVHLMDQEYYAMRLVVEAKGYTGYPEQLDSVELVPQDAALPSGEKLKRATEIVFADDYYTLKDQIRGNMKECQKEIEKLTNSIDAEELSALHRELNFVRFVILLLIITILFMVWLTSHLGINPVLKAVDQIKADSPIPEVGANEFRYLAQAYNKMYSVYKNSIAHLNFKASHDELTGAYNRAGYDLLLSSIDLESTYMLLFDVDNFKSINDTYGHETGDKVLIKLVQVLRGSFRSDDHICRIGGDEFVVFMVHSSRKQQDLIAKKIEQINKELLSPEDGLPSVSLSVGIVHGTQVDNIAGLFECSDVAMYKSKEHGKHTYTFYD